jgi:ribosomal protein L2
MLSSNCNLVKIRKIPTNCTATIGSVFLKPILNKTKAGINRCQGKRPIVRGSCYEPR